MLSSRRAKVTKRGNSERKLSDLIWSPIVPSVDPKYRDTHSGLLPTSTMLIEPQKKVLDCFDPILTHSI